jgi:ribosomal-protein-alanine N-acetyltransferase
VHFWIEPMHPDDVPRVQQIERQSFSSGTAWSAATYLRELRSPSHARYIVARASRHRPAPASPPEPRRRWLAQWLPGLGASAQPSSPYPVVGYAGLWLSLDEAHITTIASAPEARRRSVGELLLNGLIDLSLDLGARFLTLEVRVGNTAAQQLYLKYGFEVRGKRPRYYTDNNEDALIMWTPDVATGEYQAVLRRLRTALAERLSRQAAAPERPDDTLNPIA